MFPTLNRIDHAIALWMRTWGVLLLRLSLGIIFLWFGALKIVGVSPAQELIERTVYWADPSWFVPLLGVWEVAIGICLIVRPLMRLAILLLFLQMPGTIMPLFLLPEVTWQIPALAPTIEGQYIIKNIVLISAAIVVGGTVRRKPEHRWL
jgi:uncharacterized membrane protein YkgB